MANINLKEKSNHGTAMFPFHIYSHLDSIGNYSVPFTGTMKLKLYI